MGFGVGFGEEFGGGFGEEFDVGFGGEFGVGFGEEFDVGFGVEFGVEFGVGIYISSFFTIKYGYEFDCILPLWEKGLVPSFDGTYWYLHSGKDADIVWKGEIK